MPKASPPTKKSAANASNGSNGSKGGKVASTEHVADSHKRRAKRTETYSKYIHRVLKQVHPNARMSKRSMSIMNTCVNDLFERMAHEAHNLVKVTGKGTLSSRDMQTAVRLMFPGELAKHAVSEGTKAVQKYWSALGVEGK